MKKELNRHIESLNEIFRFIKSFIDDEQLDQDLESPLNLVIEELFINALRYNPGRTDKIHLELYMDDDKLIIILTEFDVEPFDIRTVDEYDVTQHLKSRPNGKLGLHLVKKYIDDIHYEYNNKESKIILIKNLRNNNA